MMNGLNIMVKAPSIKIKVPNIMLNALNITIKPPCIMIEAPNIIIKAPSIMMEELNIMVNPPSIMTRSTEYNSTEPLKTAIAFHKEKLALSVFEKTLKGTSEVPILSAKLW